MSVCTQCDYTTGGLLHKCPNCGSEKIDWWSRITGYYQNVSGWNKGKLAELSQRRRYGTSTGDEKGLSPDMKKKTTGGIISG